MTSTSNHGLATFGPQPTLDRLADEIVAWLNAEGIPTPNARIEMTHTAVPLGFAGVQYANSTKLIGLAHYFCALVAWSRP